MSGDCDICGGEHTEARCPNKARTTRKLTSELMCHYLWLRERMAGGKIDPRKLNTDEWLQHRKEFVKLMMPIYRRQKGLE